MADERIDIEINDKIDASIPKKLRDIATNADKGHTAVLRLKRDLASINATPAVRLKQATDSVTNSLNRELGAQRSVKAARDANASAIGKEAAQRDRISAMVERSIAQQEREAAALRSRVNAGGTIGDEFRGSRAVAAAQTAELRAETERLTTARRADAAAARLQEAATESATGALNRNGRAAGINRQHMLNLGFQLQDIVVGLTSGQRPLTVFLQQGAQIQGIMGQAGLGIGGLAKAVWSLVGRFVPLLAVAGAFIGIFKTLQAQFNEGSRNIDPFVKSLGLTKDELKELGDTSITTSDMMAGLWATVKEALGLSPIIESVTNFFASAWDFALSFVRNAFIGFYGLVVGGMRGIAEIISKLPTVVAATARAIANGAIAAIEWLLNKTIDGLNALTGPIAGLLAEFGVEVGKIGRVSFGRFAMSAEDSANTVGAIMRDNVVGSIQEADATLSGFTQRWQENADAARRARLQNRAAELIADRPETKGGKPDNAAAEAAERRAHALDMVNLGLDNELARMKLLKPEREIAQRMDQIEEQLAQKKIKLTDLERQAIEGKLRAIQEYSYVQNEADRILEASIAPQRTYNASLQAATELLAQGAISQADYARETTLAARALAEANDPLFAMKEALEAATVAAGLYGQEVQRNTYYEQVRQAFLSKGIVLSQQYAAGTNAEVDALMRKNDALLQQQYIQSQIGSIIDPMLQDQMFLDNKANLYAEVERLRQQDLLSEENAERAKAAIRARYNEIQLAGAQSFFGELAGLSSAGNKKLAAIGKAAAIAQATIDGYVAVQKALASAPPPWNFALASAVAVKTGVQVAGIASTNVGSFADGGQFMVDGRAGVDRNNINMNVSRGERVTIETPAQQRSNDGAAPNVEVPITIVNVDDAKKVGEYMGSAEGKRIIMNTLRDNPRELSSIIQQGANT
jgi:hypothetical protein